MTSGGLGGGVGVESTRDRVSGGEDCNNEAPDCSGKDWSVTAESQVPSTGPGRRAGGRDRVVRVGAVMTTDGCLQRERSDLTAVTGWAKLCYPFLGGEHLRYPYGYWDQGKCYGHDQIISRGENLP